MKALSLLLVAATLAAAPTVAGGPWMSVELPPNPMDEGTRGAFAVVHTYRHGEPMPYLVVGTAEGLNRGERRSLPLTITSTGRTGTMAIARSWPAEGVWVLKLGVQGENLGAAIGVGADGEAAFVRIPTTRNGAPRTVTNSDVEAMLSALASGSRIPSLAVR